MDKNNITFVTALYNLKRETLSEGFSRPMSHYYETFKKLLDQDINLVVYCDEEVKRFVEKHRDSKNTKIICKGIDFPFKKETDSIRTTPEWYKQASWLEESPQAKLEYYNPLVMSKFFWVNDTSIHNYFGSKYFFWIDSGISNTVNIDHYFKQPDFDYKLIQDVKNNKLLFVAFPYDGQNEVHGFKKEGMNRFSGVEDTEYVCRGGFFGGTRDVLNRVNALYYRTLEDTLKNGYMGTEESVFTIISYTHSENFNIQMINMNGLIGTYFDRVNAREGRLDNEIAFYFLSFNAPQQLDRSLKQFRNAFPKDFANAKRYLINNSTNSEYENEYKRIINDYHLEEHKFDNIGITGGRMFASEHFDKSAHKYMIFFEDDMIVNDKSSEGQSCRTGFKRFDSDLFEKSITILEEHELDYLKLTFTEFFGDNNKCWAWENMGEDDRKKYLRNSETPENKTRFFFGGSYKGLPYAIGEFHYCNWPILFSKDGNRKTFINEFKEKRIPESVLMANMQKLMRDKKVKAGVLLASPITHHRFKHYGKGTRVENRY